MGRICFKRDGNEIEISKFLVTIISVFLVMIGMAGGAAMKIGNIESQVQTNYEDISLMIQTDKEIIKAVGELQGDVRVTDALYESLNKNLESINENIESINKKIQELHVK